MGLDLSQPGPTSAVPHSAVEAQEIEGGAGSGSLAATQLRESREALVQGALPPPSLFVVRPREPSGSRYSEAQGIEGGAGGCCSVCIA